MATILSLVNLLCRLVLATIFLIAGIPKILGLQEFAGIIGAYGLLPDYLLYPAAVIVASLEVVAAIGLLMNKKFAVHLTLVLLGLFIGVLSYGLVMGLDIDCGCFAREDPEFKAFSSLKWALVKDIFLLVPLIYLYFQETFNRRIMGN